MNFSPIFVFNPLPQLLYMKSMIYVPSKKILVDLQQFVRILDARSSPLTLKDLFHVLLCQTFFDESHSNLEKKWTRYCWYKHITTTDELKKAPSGDLYFPALYRRSKKRGLHTHYTREEARRTNVGGVGPPHLGPWPTLSISLTCTF